jgi:hypothetical protein
VAAEWLQKLYLGLDRRKYPSGAKVSIKDMDNLNILHEKISWRIELYIA